MITVEMKYCKFEIHAMSVATRYDSDYIAWAYRELTGDNQWEAESQGYSGEDAVWKSLVEHEYLHSLISELLYDRPSLVLETESGRKFHPSWLRYQEEAIVIGVQYLLNHKGDTSELWGETWNLLLSNIKLRNQPDWLLLECESRIANIWSQVEKESI